MIISDFSRKELEIIKNCVNEYKMNFELGFYPQSVEVTNQIYMEIETCNEVLDKINKLLPCKEL